MRLYGENSAPSIDSAANRTIAASDAIDHHRRECQITIGTDATNNHNGGDVRIAASADAAMTPRSEPARAQTGCTPHCNGGVRKREVSESQRSGERDHCRQNHQQRHRHVHQPRRAPRQPDAKADSEKRTDEEKVRKVSEDANLLRHPADERQLERENGKGDACDLNRDSAQVVLIVSGVSGSWLLALGSWEPAPQPKSPQPRARSLR